MNPYRNRIQAQTIKSFARGLATDKYGNKLSARKFDDILKKNKKLQKMAYRSTSLSDHEAKKFLDAFTKEIGKEGTPLRYSMAARKMRLDERSKYSDFRDFKIKNAYKFISQQEYQKEEALKPQGPTPEETLRAKRREEAKKAFHRYEASKERAEAEKKGGVDDNAATSISDKQKRQNVKEKGAEKKTNSAPKPGFRMPMTGGGVPSTQRNPQRQGNESQSLFPDAPPLDDGLSQDGDKAPPATPDEDTGTSDEAFSNKQQESPDNGESLPSEPSDGGLFAD